MKTRQMNAKIASEEPSSASGRVRSRLLWVSLGACLALGWGCDRAPKSSPPQDKPDAVEQRAGAPDAKGVSAKDALAKDMLAKAGPIEVTLQDFEYAMDLRRLVTSMDQIEPPEQMLRSRRSQMLIIEDLISDSVVEHELSRRGLTLSRAEKVAGLRTEPGLARYAVILESPQTRPEASDAADALGTAEASAAKEALAELKARGLERKDLEYVAKIVAGQLKLRDALLAEIPETDVWAYFARKNDRAKVLAFSMSNSPTLDELMHVVESEPEKIDAYFKKNQGRWKRKGKEVVLDDALRRQIAGILLAERSVIASVRSKMMEAIQIVQDAKTVPQAGQSKAARERATQALRKKLEAAGATVYTPPVFSREREGFIPEIGLSEELASAIFASELSEPISPEPILSRQKAWGFLLLERERPSREAFEAQKKAARAEYIEKIEGVIVDRYVQNFFASRDPELDFKPLEEAYGPDESAR